MSTFTTTWKFSVNPAGKVFRRNHPDYGLTRLDRPSDKGRAGWTINFKLRDGEGHGREHRLSFSCGPLAIERVRSIRDYLRACVDNGLIGSRQGWESACNEARKAMLEKGWISIGPHNRVIVH